MPDFLTTYAQTQPNKMAVIEDRPDRETRSLTWSELNIQVNKLANVLLASGNVEPGTKMVWCGPNSIGIVIMANAARKLGVTAVPLNYRLSDDEAAYVTDHSDATVVYVDAEYAKLFERIRNQLPKVNLILVYDGAAPSEMDSADELMSSASDQEPLVPLDREPGGTMIYTSGTTGKPKGALAHVARFSRTRCGIACSYRVFDGGYLHHDRPAVSQWPWRIHGHRTSDGTDCCFTAQV